ncbi:MAG: tripartite tricarboxylate transporter permease [Burkholderiales bacterium]|nr:tripartite tricarboxylate transporter permease [Burkholderiales bacterium]MDE1927145.1 tripartite tricarboxylate transporter permease [Burkholderiales bacterium]
MIWTGLLDALHHMLSIDVALGLLGGAILGYLIGSIPGLSSSIGIALLIPFTYSLSPVTSIVLLVTLYMATEYAGAIPAILMNTPGVPAAAVTALEGYPMRLRGEAGTALTMSILSAGFGSICATLMLIACSTWIASVALAFGPVEYFAIALLGLSMVSSLSGDSMLKGFMALFFGLGVAMIGTDPMDGTPRYVLTDSLLSGVPFIPALIGLFALSSVFTLVETSAESPAPLQAVPEISGQLGLMRPHLGTLLRSTVLGFLVSVIPGHGATISAFISYAFQKRLSKHPETFGKGNPEGLIASEAAANASVPGALAPMLSLGIPGSASTAVLIGALTLHGVQPGPLLFTRNPEIPFSIFIALIVTMPFMVALGLGGIRLWVKVTAVPRSVIAGLVGAMCLLGSYASMNDMFAIWTTIVFGILGYFLHKVRIQPAPIVLALILGGMTESNFRRSLMASGGNYATFVTHPVGVICAVLALLVFLMPFLRRKPQRPALVR